MRIRTEWGTRTPAGKVVKWETERMAREMSSLTGHPLAIREVRESEWEDVK